LLALAGFIFGEHWREVREAMRPFDITFIIVCLILVGLYVYRHLKHAREDNEHATLSASPSKAKEPEA
jgi:hypothetical protein